MTASSKPELDGKWAPMQYRISPDGIYWSKWAALYDTSEPIYQAAFVQARILVGGEWRKSCVTNER